MRRRDHDMAAEVRRLRERLHVIEAIDAAMHDPHRVLDVLTAAADIESGIVALQEEFGWSRVQATAATDVQFRRAVGIERARIHEQVAEVRTLLARSTNQLRTEQAGLSVPERPAPAPRRTRSEPRRRPGRQPG
ncbi:hypothetical protein GCM10009798_07490 [Nocardioides panacihumi]|uniref:DNA topoisomerase (ATP-hydrolyzing) n=1 Tax=Nocardioides panacihumi TaxID=400774 RepID=A0ABN2QF14_9ACTN